MDFSSAASGTVTVTVENLGPDSRIDSFFVRRPTLGGTSLAGPSFSSSDWELADQTDFQYVVGSFGLSFNDYFGAVTQTSLTSLWYPGTPEGPSTRVFVFDFGVDFSGMDDWSYGGLPAVIVVWRSIEPTGASDKGFAMYPPDLDESTLVLVGQILPGGEFQISCPSQKGFQYALWVSSDLEDWHDTAQSQDGNGSDLTFTTSGPTPGSPVFYRVDVAPLP